MKGQLLIATQLNFATYRDIATHLRIPRNDKMKREHQEVADSTPEVPPSKQSKLTSDEHHDTLNVEPVQPTATPAKGFMSLPRELRDQVYETLLPNRTLRGKRHAYKLLFLVDGKLGNGVRGLELLRTSSQIHKEFSECIYSCTFTVSRQGALLDLDTQLPTEPARNNIRKLQAIFMLDDSNVAKLPRREPLQMMQHLTHFAFCVRLSTTWNHIGTDDALEDSTAVNGLVAHVCCSVPSSITSGLNALDAGKSPAILLGWRPVATAKFQHLIRKYKVLQP